MPIQNAEIASMFDQAAELLEIKGDNPFQHRHLWPRLGQSDAF
ncbi:helix-hairpin-helix domain-containing protein [Methylocystis sp. IM3]